MLGLCLGEEAFGKGLAAKREQHQADIELECMVAAQTRVGRGGLGGGRLRDGWGSTGHSYAEGLGAGSLSQSHVPTTHSYSSSHRVLRTLFLAHLKFGQEEQNLPKTFQHPSYFKQIQVVYWRMLPETGKNSIRGGVYGTIAQVEKFLSQHLKRLILVSP